MDQKIYQYHDWWFDNALEFLGYLLEEIGVHVDWEDGIEFASLEKSKIEQLVNNIDKLIKFKLTYQITKNDGTTADANRAYLPTMHKGKYVNFLGKDPKIKQEICGHLFSLIGSKKRKICDICSDYYEDEYKTSQVSQTIYPVATGSLKSQCGIRKMEPEYHACPNCALLGSIEWLDDNPFACDTENLTNYILFPKIEDLYELHIFKNELREIVTQRRNSNILGDTYLGKQGLLQEKYARDEFSLLLLLFEQMKTIEHCDEWVCLRISGTSPTYQMRNTYLEEIRIPNIASLERIFRRIERPYSNIIDKSFTKSLINDKIDYALSNKNKNLMSKGIIMDDFKTFAEAFKIRQNCILAGLQKEMIYALIDLWRCKDGTV